MKFSDSIKLAFSNLKKRKGRTFLTALAVAIGTTLIVTMVGLGSTGEKYILDEMSKHSNIKKINVIPQKYQSFDEMMNESTDENMDYEEMMEKNFKRIDNRTVDKIKNLKGVNEISASIFSRISEIKIGDKKQKNNLSIIGYKDAQIFLNNEINALKLKNKDFKPIIAGRNLTANDKDAMIISQRVLKEMGITDYKSVVGKEFTIISNQASNGMKLKPLNKTGKVIGVIDEKIDAYSGKIVVPLKTSLEFKNYETFDSNFFENKGYNDINIFAKDEDSVKTVGQALKTLGYQYESYEVIAEQVKSVFAVLKGILSSLGIIVLFVAALGIINTMIMSTYERTKSIGIMKSIGASTTNIKNIFVVESGTIGFIGGIMGLLFSFINSKIIEFAISTYLKSKQATDVVIKFYMPNWLVWGSLVFAIVLAVLSGLYPSSRAAKLDPIEALNSK
ncbi:FtsX-like permease family protein [Clostridium sp. KNHs214]|uniref:ABC transporter permease n=1 Tax=Clostridium sp. KNHs214 TaxID=1540257 RepID=UPI000552E740|nr:FtsX-like permease family protein [Clostridium sp. KNHs214]